MTSTDQNDYNDAPTLMLQTATTQEIIRLLGLFPVIELRHRWPEIDGKKEDICAAVAKMDRQAILNFMVDRVRCCKQHGYVFSRPNSDMKLFPNDVPSGEKVFQIEGVRALYVIRLVHSVVLLEPLEEATESFLWPMWVEFTPSYIAVRFVVLEKDLKSYFNRPYQLGRKDVDEKTVLNHLTAQFGMGAADLHKGVKQLWADDFLDAFDIEFKRPMSVASESMDQQMGIKEYNPELFDVVQTATLFRTTFRTLPGVLGPSLTFHIDPTRGTIDFPCYSDYERGSDFVVNTILRQNE